MIKFLDLTKQYESICEEIDNAISDVIKSAQFINGPQVSQFEEAFAAFQSARYCVGVANGTDAIEIAIEALSLPEGSEIIVPANSFIASSEAVTRAGHNVVFADAEVENYSINLDSVKEQITPKTSAILVVHLYGHPCDMTALKNLADEYGIKIIEDCAQAHGAEYEGTRVGAIGDVGCFSFYPGKNLGAYGDAGAILTNDQGIAERCRMIANHGRLAKYDHLFEGRNSRMDTLQAAILEVKLRYLPEWLERRRQIAQVYSEGIRTKSLILPKNKENVLHAYHLYVVRTDRRNAFVKHLGQNGIESGIHYPICLPRLRAYENHFQAQFPFECAPIAGEVCSLPIGEHMSLKDAERVVSIVNQF